MNQLSAAPGLWHQAVVSAVALAGDGTVLSVGYDGALVVSRVGDTRVTPLCRFDLHAKGVNCVALSPDGRLAVTGGSDSAACLVSLEDGQVRRLEHPGDVECAVFSRDGRWLLTGGTNGEARIWETASCQLLCVVVHGGTVGASCTRGELFVTGCNDFRLRTIDPDGQVRAALVAAELPIKAVVNTRLGVVLSSHDCTIRLVDLDHGATRILAQRSTTPKALAATDDGRAVWVGCYDQTVSRLELDGAAGDGVASIRLEMGWAHGLAARGQLLAVGSFDAAPLVLDVSGPVPRLLDDRRRRVPCISALVPAGPGRVVVGGDSGLLRERSLAGDAEAEKVRGEAPSAVTGLCRVGDDLVVCTWGGEVFRLRGGERLWSASWPGPRADAPVLCIDADERFVIAGLYTGGTVAFDAGDGRWLWRQSEATGAVKDVGLHGPYYAATGRYDPLRIGRAQDGDVLAWLPLDTPVSDVVSFCPYPRPGQPPRLAVTARDNEVWMVDVQGGTGRLHLEIVHRGDGHTLPVKALAWLDGDTVVAGDYAGRVQLHRLGMPSQTLAVLNSRLGVSALAVLGSALVWSTFDGQTGILIVEKGAQL
jgi:WD40 repeat protein